MCLALLAHVSCFFVTGRCILYSCSFYSGPLRPVFLPAGREAGPGQGAGVPGARPTGRRVLALLVRLACVCGCGCGCACVLSVWPTGCGVPTTLMRPVGCVCVCVREREREREREGGGLGAGTWHECVCASGRADLGVCACTHNTHTHTHMRSRTRTVTRSLMLACRYDGQRLQVHTQAHAGEESYMVNSLSRCSQDDEQAGVSLSAAAVREREREDSPVMINALGCPLPGAGVPTAATL